MADRREGGPPSLGMVAAGGVGVLVVVAFVAAVALGGRAQGAGPASRLAVGRADGEGSLAVFVPRCRDERVTSVEVSDGSGRSLWRITSRKGSIDERYVVGAEPPPLGFDVDVPLDGPLPASALVASVSVSGDGEDVRDDSTFDAGAVPEGAVLYRGEPLDLRRFEARALAAASCPESRSGGILTTVVFGLGGAVVVASYGLMVSRWWRGRGRS